jgi:CRISPR system Cascade subunit CasA
MRPTRVSDKGAETLPKAKGAEVEAFFGQPRRLQLVGEEAITGVIQKPWGTNYGLWTHPLTPYYRQKPGAELLPVHPRAGVFGYRHWLGILAEAGEAGLRDMAQTLRDWRERNAYLQLESTVILAGWAMDNMKPRDFTWSVQPMISLDPEGQAALRGLILGAEQAALALRAALASVLAEGEAREAEREAFYRSTEPAFLSRLQALKVGQPVAEGWREDLAAQALSQFDALALPGLDQRETDQIARIVQARSFLSATFWGFTPYGEKLFDALDLPKPEKPKKRKVA